MILLALWNIDLGFLYIRLAHDILVQLINLIVYFCLIQGVLTVFYVFFSEIEQCAK